MEIHIDCDNGWVYSNDLKISEIAKLSVYAESIPLFIELLNKYQVRGVFFIVGQDLNDDKFANYALRSAILKGNLIGNHTYTHSPHYGELSHQEKIEEFKKCDLVIREKLNIKPIHFRAPGYSFDNKLAHKIYEENYKYESSFYNGIYLLLLKVAFSLFRSEKKISHEKPWKSNKQVKIQKIQTYTKLKLPIHSSFLALYPKWLRSRIIKEMKTSEDYYLFHAVDLVPNLERNIKIPISRISFEERYKMVESIIAKVARN